jgi:hypothetical protein
MIASNNKICKKTAYVFARPAFTSELIVELGKSFSTDKKERQLKGFNIPSNARQFISNRNQPLSLVHHDLCMIVRRG